MGGEKRSGRLNFRVQPHRTVACFCFPLVVSPLILLVVVHDAIERDIEAKRCESQNTVASDSRGKCE